MTAPAPFTCPSWCTRTHDLRDGQTIRHSATVAERQIGDALITIAVKWTVRLPDHEALLPHITVTIAEAGKTLQLDPVTEEALILADLLEMAGADRWLVDALTEAAQLIGGEEDEYRWRVAP